MVIQVLIVQELNNHRFEIKNPIAIDNYQQ